MSTVTNPYTFNITSNKIFTSPTISSNLPSSETKLILISVITGAKSFTIPSGCKVVRVEYESGPNTDGTGNPSSIYIKSNQKTWLDWTGGISWEDGVAGSFYVGVTPGKTYTITVYGAGDDPGCLIYYSASINNQTPNITDY